MSDEEWQKLKEIMEKIGVKDVQDGFMSEKLRSCINKLHYHIVVHGSQTAVVNPSRSKPKFLTKKPDTRKCPQLDEGELEEMGMSFSELCQSCHDKAHEVWKKCSARE